MSKWHPNKDVSDVIQSAVERGWRVIPGSGHCYCTLRCPEASRSGCQVRVFSTPQNPGNHARILRAKIESCPH